MADKKVRVGVVGVGHFGRNHARIYARMPDVELALVADPDEDRREAMCDQYGCRGVKDYSEVEGVDAVSVAVPTVHHERVACHFLEQGIPVLVEKPLADSVGAAERIVEAARANGTFVGVGHVERFNPVVKAATSLGIEPLFIECHRLSPYPMRGQDVSVVHDLMIHDLEIVLAMDTSGVAAVEASGVAGGISEALITTATGLMIALFAVIPYNVFLSMSEGIELEIEETSSELLDHIATFRAAKA